MANVAYIDGQNLTMATRKAKDPWAVDLYKFRKYLQNKYKVERAYYFVGAYQDTKSWLYTLLQEAGYIVIFRIHGDELKSNKKGNVDVDIVFYAMRDLLEKSNEYNRAVFVSGDGDYIRVVEYLLENNKLEKVLHPSKKFASSLYKRLSREYYAFLDTQDMRKLLEYEKR